MINAMNPFDCEPEYSDFVLVDKEGLANTAVVWHAGRLLAMEEGHPPMRSIQILWTPSAPGPSAASCTAP